MKNKFLYILFLITGLMFISGCGNGNFFDVQSTMNPPTLTQEQEKTKTSIKEHFAGDFTWKYPLIDGNYSPITKVNLTSNSDTYQLVFCQVLGETHKIHMLILRQNKDDWEVVEDITYTALDIEKVYIRDIDKDSANEIVVSVKNFEDSYNLIYAYKYSDDHLSEISVPADFFD